MRTRVAYLEVFISFPASEATSEAAALKAALTSLGIASFAPGLDLQLKRCAGADEAPGANDSMLGSWGLRVFRREKRSSTRCQKAGHW